jgi:hypothetical protein
MRSRKVYVNADGGLPGCLLMIVVSVLLSALCTLAANLLGR